MRTRALAVLLVLLAAGLVGLRAEAADLSVATRFFPDRAQISVEPVAGSVPHAVLRSADRSVLGYAFSTREVSGSVGYSGRPLDVVAAVTPQGIIAGALIVAHQEPILVIGIPREAVAAYVANFKGFDVLQGSLQGARGRAPAAVAGASVTSAVIRDAIVRSARAVLRAGSGPALEQGKARLDRETLRRASWPALVAEGSLRRLLLSRGEAAILLRRPDQEPEKPFIDIWLALATPPPIGESLLGQRLYESELAKLGADDDLLLIAASGLYSFQGTNWRRSGVFDRIELVQADRTIKLTADNHTRVEALAAPGSPELREISLFRIPHATGFDSTAAFRLDLILERSVPDPAPPPVVSLDYRIPDRYLVQPAATRPRQPPASATIPGDAPSQAPSAASPAAGIDGAAPPAAAAPAEAPLWQDIWWARRFHLAGLAVMLAGLSVILIFQDAVVARGLLYRRLRIGYLLVTLIFLGFIANAQLSVVNVVTFLHALLSGFRWELFLLDPVVFVLWSVVAVSMLFWGRGVFCGWLCPFGALQELLNKLARALGIRQVVIRFGLHERLWMIKYVIFLGILAVSLNSILGAFGLAEVEPFKTAITMKFMRDWPFVAYALALLTAGIFVERFFCRYLCPLGGALAIPARMRMFEWLKRYRECGAECQICALHCTVQAIHPLGQINPNECIYCLQCQANYFDGAVCLHLKKRAERRRPRVVTPAAATAAAGKNPGGDVAT
jgi:transcriptional regulator of nitric oxide reductase